MPKNKERKMNNQIPSGDIGSHVEFGKRNSFSIITPENEANIICVNCAAPPECRGQSPKKEFCDIFHPRK